jgi:hypothetical protein
MTQPKFFGDIDAIEKYSHLNPEWWAIQKDAEMLHGVDPKTMPPILVVRSYDPAGERHTDLFPITIPAEMDALLSSSFTDGKMALLMYMAVGQLIAEAKRRVVELVVYADAWAATVYGDNGHDALKDGIANSPHAFECLIAGVYVGHLGQPLDREIHKFSDIVSFKKTAPYTTRDDGTIEYGWPEEVHVQAHNPVDMVLSRARHIDLFHVGFFGGYFTWTPDQPILMEISGWERGVGFRW